MRIFNFLRIIFNEIKFLNCVYLGASFKNILGFLMNFWGPIVTFYFLKNLGFIRIFFRFILRIFFYIFQSSHRRCKPICVLIRNIFQGYLVFFQDFYTLSLWIERVYIIWKRAYSKLRFYTLGLFGSNPFREIWSRSRAVRPSVCLSVWLVRTRIPIKQHRA